MKIRCDVCENGEASVFCVADEASLCVTCDHRVHHANKLAGKHQRFSLLIPPPEQLPVCDICQERIAFVFCQQDRAILCRECDIPIHKSNTIEHNRFLFTAIKLSLNSELYSSSSSSTAEAASRNSVSDVSNTVPNLNSQDLSNKDEILKNPQSVSKGFSSGIGNMASTDEKYNNGFSQTTMNENQISDESIDMLFDWQVEDFLDPLFFNENGGNDCDLMPFWDCPELCNNNNNNVTSFSNKSNNGDWAPQAASIGINPFENQVFSDWNIAAFGGQISFKQDKDKEDIGINLKAKKKWNNEDNSFVVPQTKPVPSSSASNKRFRSCTYLNSTI